TPGRRARCNESRFPPSARSCEYCTLAAERRKVVFRTPILAGSLVLCAAALCGQDVIGARAGAVLFTGGGVFVNGNPVRVQSQKYPLLKDGDVLRTARGRVE